MSSRKLIGSKPLSVLIILLVSLTVLLSILYLFTPVLIGYQTTSNGIIEYFTNSFDPSFVVKAYLDGSPTNAIISVFINQPNGIKFYEEYYGETLKIPFSAIASYVRPWERYKDVNTSILVIATYVNGNKTYSSAEDIEYNPSWVLNNMPIQIVAKVNIIPKLIKLNTTAIADELHSLRKIIANRTHYNYAYIVNMSQEAYTEPPVHITNYVYMPVTNIIYLYNFSVPINWITLSNSVNKKDNYSGISIFTHLVGSVSWCAVSNSTNYGGPYIGISYSANVNWNVLTFYSKSILSSLYDPTIYNYYNATIAVIVYRMYHLIHYLRIPVGSVTVFQVLWASPNINGAVESGNGITCVVYTNSSGTYYYPLRIGSGSVTAYYTFFKKYIGNLRSKEYGYAIWNKGSVKTGNPVEPAGEPTIGCVWFTAGSLDEHVHKDMLASIAFGAAGIIVSLVLSLIGGNTAIIVTGALISIKLAEHFLVSSTQTETYFTNTLVTMNIITKGTGQFYVSYLNFSDSIRTTLLGFILNYSSYYEG